MKHENESARMPPEKNSGFNTAGRQREVTPAARANSDDVTINFHSTEFNRVDDLNDCAGNYRSFQSLEGIVTAHEHHQRELRRGRDALDPSRDGPVRARKSEVRTDEGEWGEAAASLTVISEGRTLIVDTDAERAMSCAKTLQDLQLPCTLMLTGSTLPSGSMSRVGRIKLLEVHSVSVSDPFGGFLAKVTPAAAGKIQSGLSTHGERKEVLRNSKAVTRGPMVPGKGTGGGDKNKTRKSFPLKQRRAAKKVKNRFAPSIYDTKLPVLFYSKLPAMISHHGCYGFRHLPQFNGVAVFSPSDEAAGQGSDTRNTLFLQ
jgi:hypothetical protein